MRSQRIPTILYLLEFVCLVLLIAVWKPNMHHWLKDNQTFLVILIQNEFYQVVYLYFNLNITKAMIMRDLNPESSEFYLYEFEFVCNFKRERLKFTEIQSHLASHQGIIIPD